MWMPNKICVPIIFSVDGKIPRFFEWIKYRRCAVLRKNMCSQITPRSVFMNTLKNQCKSMQIRSNTEMSWPQNVHPVRDGKKKSPNAVSCRKRNIKIPHSFEGVFSKAKRSHKLAFYVSLFTVNSATKKEQKQRKLLQRLTFKTCSHLAIHIAPKFCPHQRIHQSTASRWPIPTVAWYPGWRK